MRLEEPSGAFEMAAGAGGSVQRLNLARTAELGRVEVGKAEPEGRREDRALGVHLGRLVALERHRRRVVDFKEPRAAVAIEHHVEPEHLHRAEGW